jgi:hypothetical protein
MHILEIYLFYTLIEHNDNQNLDISFKNNDSKE